MYANITGRRAVLAVMLLAGLLFAMIRPAFAASILTNVSISPAAQGARVVLTFAGGVPQGWRVDGNGSEDIVIRLPAVQQSARLNQIQYPGANSVSSVTVVNTGAEIDVELRIAGRATAKYAATFDSIIVNVPPASRTLPPSANAEIAATPVGGLQAAQQFGTTGSEITQVITLRYADVSEVAGVLGDTGTQVASNDIFSPSGSIFSLPTQNGPLGASQQQQLLPNQSGQQSIGQRISAHVAVDRRLNAVIITGQQAEVDAMRTLIAELDVPVPSVILETEVVELSTNTAKDLGIDYTSGPNGPIATASGTLGVPNSTTGAQTPVYSAQFSAKLFATIQSGGGRILASPRVLAQNGVAAQILTGDALPIITTTTFPGPPITTQQTVNYIAVGVNLQIMPRIAQNGDVTSHVYAEVSSVTAEIATPQGNVPQISLRQATTLATVHDGQSFVVGGLLKDEEIKSLARLPGLGSLPVIGAFFRVEHETHQVSNLYVIITPHVVSPTVYEQPPNDVPRLKGPIPKPTGGPPLPTAQPIGTPPPDPRPKATPQKG